MLAKTRKAAARPIFRVAVAAASAVALTIASWVADARLAPTMGFREMFFDGATPGGAPRLVQVTKAIDLACLDENPSLPRRNFRVRWEGIWHVSESRWTDLYFGADDRGVVTLDGRQVIERNAAIGMGTERARFLLTSGDHYLVVDYEQDGGDYHVGMLTGPAGDAPHSFADEAVYPSTPGRKTLVMVERLSWLRRAAILAWWLLAFVLFVTFRGQWFLGAIRDVWRDWLARHRLNWRRWREGDSSGGCAGTVPADLRHRPAIAALYVLAVVAGLALFTNFYDARTGFTRLIGFGGNFADRALPAVRAVPHYTYEGESGYDGQFYAQLAVEPSPASADVNSALDTVPYRARRMLFSWTAFALGLGRPSWVLHAYAVQNILAWLFLAALLCRWLPPVSVRRFAAWCACLFTVGLILSLRFSLTEGPGLALIALAVAAAEKGMPLAGAAVVGIAGLGRETSLLASPACLLPSLPRRRPWLTLLLMGVLLIAPLLLWLTYLSSLLGPRVWGAGGDDFSYPLAGFIGKIETTHRQLRLSGWLSPVRDNVLALVGFVVQAAYLVFRAEWQSAWWRAGIPYLLLAAMLPAPMWAETPGSYLRLTLPMTVAFNVLLPSGRAFWPIFILGNLSVVVSLSLLMSGLPR